MSEVLGINGFIKKIIALYPASFKGDQYIIDTWSEAAVRNLYNPRVDYTKLLDAVISNNPRGNFAPDFPWMIEESKKCYLKGSGHKSEWLQPKIYNPISKNSEKASSWDAFPIGTTEEQIIKTYEKKHPNTTGWKVVGYV